ncbi:1-aminocyclopropane-1-carboxylate synthase-like protein 1 isoform X2 [Glandiceps talaboti]
MHMIEPWMLQYCDPRGIYKLREAVGRHLSWQAKSSQPIKADDITILHGAESVITSLMQVICDPGDGFLVPSPCYGGGMLGVTNSLKRIPEVKPVYVHLGSQVNFAAGETRPFQLSVDRIEQAYKTATESGVNVRGIFLINPHNPTGEIYTAELLRDCLDFAHRHSLHVVIDEIYMGTIFHQDVNFTSVLSLDCVPDPHRTHLIWGLSKDFGMAGYRCGVLHSLNPVLHKAMEYLAYFHSIAASTQNMLAEFLSDSEWIKNVFFPANHQRLRESYQCMSDGLTELGVPHLHRSSGLYIWADFRLYLSAPTKEEESSLHNRLQLSGVGIRTGDEFDCEEPGWFRIIFAHPVDILKIALERIGRVLNERKKEICGDELVMAEFDGIQTGILDNAASCQDGGHIGSAAAAATSTGDNVEDLMASLHQQIKTSDWLKQNTAENWVEENPELYKEYKEAAAQDKK